MPSFSSTPVGTASTKGPLSPQSLGVYKRSLLPLANHSGTLVDVVDATINLGVVDFLAYWVRAAMHAPTDEQDSYTYGPCCSHKGATICCDPLDIFIEKTLVHSGTTAPVILSVAVLLGRLRRVLPSNTQAQHFCTVHRIFLATLMLAHKSLNDHSPSNAQWAKLSGNVFDTRTILSMEQDLLGRLHYDVSMKDEAEMIGYARHMMMAMGLEVEPARRKSEAIVIKLEEEEMSSLPGTPQLVYTSLSSPSTTSSSSSRQSTATPSTSSASTSPTLSPAPLKPIISHRRPLFTLSVNGPGEYDSDDEAIVDDFYAEFGGPAKTDFLPLSTSYPSSVPLNSGNSSSPSIASGVLSMRTWPVQNGEARRGRRRVLELSTEGMKGQAGLMEFVMKGRVKRRRVDE